MVLNDFTQQIAQAINYLDKNNKECDETALNKILKDTALVLLQFDVNVQQFKQFKENVIQEYSKIIESQEEQQQSSTDNNMNKLIKQAILRELTRLFEATKTNVFMPVKNQQNIVMFVGIRGAGKTTTVMKYANYWKRKGWKVGIVCAETTKPNVFSGYMGNHLKSKIPFYGSYTETDSVKIAEDGVEMFKKENYEIIIVDTCGIYDQVADKDICLLEQIKIIQSSVNPIECILVVDGTLGQASCNQTILVMKNVHISSVILTKLDGNKKGPGAIGSIVSLGVSIPFICTGEHIEDLEPFNGSLFIKRIEKDETKINFPLTFQLRQLKEQLEDVLKFQPIGAILKYIPFFSNKIISDNEQEEQIIKIKKYVHIMDSMNDEELDGEVELCKSRVERIAQGSGTNVEDVHELLKQFKRFSNICTGPNGISCTHQNQHNIKNMKNLQIDPKILKTMGGKEALMNMMKQLGGDKFMNK